MIDIIKRHVDKPLRQKLSCANFGNKFLPYPLEIKRVHIAELYVLLLIHVRLLKSPFHNRRKLFLTDFRFRIELYDKHRARTFRFSYQSCNVRGGVFSRFSHFPLRFRTFSLGCRSQVNASVLCATIEFANGRRMFAKCEINVTRFNLRSRIVKCASRPVKAASANVLKARSRYRGCSEWAILKINGDFQMDLAKCWLCVQDVYGKVSWNGFGLNYSCFRNVMYH